MNTKPWGESKAIWLNAGALAVAVLTSLLGTEAITSHPQLVAVFVATIAVLNVVLRSATATTLTAKSSAR